MPVHFGGIMNTQRFVKLKELENVDEINVDTSFYESVEKELLEMGFRLLGDWVDTVVETSYLRTFISPDNQFSCNIYSLWSSFHSCYQNVADVVSNLEDDTELLTTNAPCHPLEPEENRVFLSNSLTVPEVIKYHQSRIRNLKNITSFKEVTLETVLEGAEAKELEKLEDYDDELFDEDELFVDIDFERGSIPRADTKALAKDNEALFKSHNSKEWIELSYKNKGKVKLKNILNHFKQLGLTKVVVSPWVDERWGKQSFKRVAYNLDVVDALVLLGQRFSGIEIEVNLNKIDTDSLIEVNNMLQTVTATPLRESLVELKERCNISEKEKSCLEIHTLLENMELPFSLNSNKFEKKFHIYKEVDGLSMLNTSAKEYKLATKQLSLCLQSSNPVSEVSRQVRQWIEEEGKSWATIYYFYEVFDGLYSAIEQDVENKRRIDINKIFRLVDLLDTTEDEKKLSPIIGLFNTIIDIANYASTSKLLSVGNILSPDKDEKEEAIAQLANMYSYSYERLIPLEGTLEVWNTFLATTLNIIEKLEIIEKKQFRWMKESLTKGKEK